ncbi:MAG TPA: hypothetical protein VLB84_11455, partial [Bacteroidia bacterium]|nr:hypothetical protein [Bacteroidia bacterium]
MRKTGSTFFIIPFIVLCFSCSLQAQTRSALQKKNELYSKDTAAVNRLLDLCRVYSSKGQLDEMLKSAQKANFLAKKINYKAGLARSFNYQGISAYRKGNYPDAVDLLKTGLFISESIKDSIIQSMAL